MDKETKRKVITRLHTAEKKFDDLVHTNSLLYQRIVHKKGMKSRTGITFDDNDKLRNQMDSALKKVNDFVKKRDLLYIKRKQVLHS